MINIPQPVKVVLVILVAAGIGYAFGRYAQPGKEVVKTVEVVKTNTVVQHDTVTVTKVIKQPNGATETDTTVTDKDVDTTHAQTNESSSETITNVKPQWKVSGQAGYNFSSFNKVYGVEVDRRILGPLFLGAWGNTDHTGGIAVSIEF